MIASEGRLWAASSACPSHLPLSTSTKLPGARLSLAQARLLRLRSEVGEGRRQRRLCGGACDAACRRSHFRLAPRHLSKHRPLLLLLQHQDRDHPGMHGGAPLDPHLINPPPVAAAPSPGFRRQQQYQVRVSSG